MKTTRLFFSLLFLLMTSLKLFAGMSSYFPDNDTVILKNGRKMVAIVKEIKDDKLMYRKTEYANLLSLPLANVKSVNYQDGRKYTSVPFKVDTLASMEQQIRTKIKMEVNQAKEDAQNTYNEGPVFMVNVLLTFLLGGLFGLIPAAAFLSSPPSDERTGLKKGATEEYNNAYREEIKQIRKKAVWNGFSIGLLLAGIFGLILLLRSITLI